MGPRISIIIPAYNAASYISRAIESLQAQTFQDFEAIVFDDGSTDQINEILPKNTDWLVYFRQENKGPSSARNKGIQLSRGEYLVFLDADDWISPDKLEIQAGYLDHHPEIGLVYSDGYLVERLPGGEENLVKFSQAGLLRRTLGEPAQNIRTLANSNGFPIHAAMVRKAAVLEAGGFDETASSLQLEDWDLWYRLGETHRFAYLDGITAYYLRSQGSLTKNRREMLAATKNFENKLRRRESYMHLSPRDQAISQTSFGLSILQFGDSRNARRHFLEAFRIYPKDMRLWLGLAVSFLGDRLGSVILLELFRAISTNGRLSRFLGSIIYSPVDSEKSQSNRRA